MGKKSSWLSSVKKVFIKSPFKDHDRRSRQNAVVETEESQGDQDHQAQQMPEIVSVSVENFPAETSPEATNDEAESRHAAAVSAATAKAAQAAIVAAEAAAKVVRLAGHGHRRLSREEKAALRIQAYYRGYLARRALRALKAVVRLQALVRGHRVRKQAQMTMRCMQALVRVQDRVMTRRRQQLSLDKVDKDDTHLSHSPPFTNNYDGDNVYNVFPQTSPSRRDHYENEGEQESITESNASPYRGWDKKRQSISAEAENLKHERALTYAIALQNGHKPADWEWSWLDRWRNNDQQWQTGNAHAVHHQMEGSYTTATYTEDHFSEETVEMDTDSRSPVNAKALRRAGESVPSYMVATQSARAKIRSNMTSGTGQHHEHWNYTLRRGLAPSESSSSGGTLGAHHQQHGRNTRAQTPRGTSYGTGSSWAGNESTPPPFGGRGRRGIHV